MTALANFYAMRWNRLSLLPLLVSLVALPACGGNADSSEPEAREPAPPPTPAWVVNGSTHTEGQAERGAQVFLDVCSVCHALDDFRQPVFHRLWSGSTVGDFYGFVASEMPYDAPGSLEPQEYADVLAFLFRENAMPPGAEELPADPALLREIHLELPSD